MSESRDHRYILDRTEDFISQYSNSEPIEGSRPDFEITEDVFNWSTDGFESIFIECEFSSVRRPSKIVDKFLNAAENNAKIIFSVPATEDNRVDYYAKRIENIIGPPNLMHSNNGKNEYILYKDSSELRTAENNYCVLSKNTDNDEKWIYKEKKDKITLSNNVDDIEICRPSRCIKPKRSNIKYYLKQDCVFDSKQNKLGNIKDLGEKYKPVTSPVYPYRLPRYRIEDTLKSVEFLIVGKNIFHTKSYSSLKSHIL